MQIKQFITYYLLTTTTTTTATTATATATATTTATATATAPIFEISTRMVYHGKDCVGSKRPITCLPLM